MNYILFDGPERLGLLPLTYTKPVGELRVGVLTLREKWKALGIEEVSYITEPYLAQKYPLNLSEENCVINGALLPTIEVLEEIKALALGQRLIKGNKVIASKLTDKDVENGNWNALISIPSKSDVFFYTQTYELFETNGKEIVEDIKRLGLEKTKTINGDGNTILGSNHYVDSSVQMDGVTINSKTGPVYIAKGAVILEGSIIRGPIAICENATIKMGAKIYGDTTIGPYCKVGGEVSNVVFQAYSNKGHDGYLGNSVIGEWCNLGADTNSSNLKNNYGNIAIWNYQAKSMIPINRQFCGVIMGDHSKTGINTMLNTGTVIGLASNIFGGGFPPKFIPSFAWGGFDKSSVFKLEKAFEVAQRMMERRNITFTAADEAIFKYVFETTVNFRQS